MRIETLTPSKLRLSSPPPRASASTPAASDLPRDEVRTLSNESAKETPVDGRKLMKIAAFGLLAAGRMVSMVPGPSALPVICAQQAQSTETRLEQVLSCALVDSPEQLTQGQDRASYAWEGLRTHMGGGMERLKERPGDGTITAWPYGQVMTAALNRAKLSGDYSDFDQLLQGLDKYQHSDGGYSPNPNRFGFEGNRFMDDNAWIGLAFVQAAQQRPDSDYLEKAESVARMLQANQSADGGLIWEEGNANPSYNTATLGPSIELSLRLYQLTGKDEYLTMASRMTEVMDNQLRQPNGLYADNVDLKTGRVEQTKWSYNQGTPVGAHLLWHEVTGDVSYLEKARQTAQAALQHYGDEGLWKQPPAFNAIFFRNLLKLNDPSADQAMQRYLDRTWTDALDPHTGLFNREGHGMGSYEGHGNVSTLDQAALTQLYALQSWSSSDRGLIS